jgi:DNA polymerase-3 subunit delta'
MATRKVPAGKAAAPVVSRKPDVDEAARTLRAPIGHDAALASLFASARAGRLAHALLFAGPEGVGKFLAARWLGAGLLCDRGPAPPCEACGPCKRVRAGTHPDLFVVDAGAEGFDKLSIYFVAHRDLRPKEVYQGPAIEDFLDLRSAEGRGKVVLVREAETLVEEAQNALLKSLEEPRPGVVLVLECSTPASLLATVRSRLVRVDFGTLQPAALAALLADEPSVAELDEQGYARLVRLAAGSPGRALRLARRGVPAMRALLDGALSGRLGPSAAARELWEIAGDFSARTESAERRLRAETFFDLGLEVLRDLERRRAGLAPDELVHGDAPAPARDGEAARRGRMDAWIAARQDVQRNLGPEALVDRALHSL